MRKLFSILFSAVLLLVVSGPGAWAQNAQLTAGGGAFAPGTVIHTDRTVLHGDIVHYRYTVAVGPGQFDKIWLHRVVKERQPYHPVRTVDGVMLFPGQPNYFESIFMEPLISHVPWDRSIAVFLANNNVDVWGMDYAWALVPAETTDFNFMKGWGVEKDARHAEVALSVARQIRGMTDQGFGPLHVIGFSYGGIIAYSVAGQETQKPRLLRNVKGLIPVDMPMKFEEKFISDWSCGWVVSDQANLDAGVYNDDTGLFFGQLGALAVSAPDDPSSVFPGLTNYQAALFGATSTWLLNGSPIFWHFNAGVGDEFEEPSWVPSGLQYTEPRLSLDLDQALPPHYPMQTNFDVDAVLCGEVKVPFDDHLGDIALPILYVGAGGGFGKYGYYTTSLTASKDVTKFTVHFQPDDQRMLDFGHADLFMAKDAETLAWRPILNWLKAHR